MTGNLEIDALFAEIDAAAEAYSRSIERGFALAAEMRQLAEDLEDDLAGSQSELMGALD